MALEYVTNKSAAFAASGQTVSIWSSSTYWGGLKTNALPLGKGEVAIASSDITQDPFVKRRNAKVTLLPFVTTEWSVTLKK